jgi:thiol-disulfide isomerase/thioredoxin
VSEASSAGNQQLQVHIRIFGKPDCGKCETTKNKVEFFLAKWNLAGRVPVRFFDMSTVDGLAEGAYYEATDIPTTLVLTNGQVVGRWQAAVPPSEELLQALTQPFISDTGATGL